MVIVFVQYNTINNYTIIIYKYLYLHKNTFLKIAFICYDIDSEKITIFIKAEKK